MSVSDTPRVQSSEQMTVTVSGEKTVTLSDDQYEGLRLLAATRWSPYSSISEVIEDAVERGITIPVAAPPTPDDSDAVDAAGETRQTTLSFIAE